MENTKLMDLITSPEPPRLPDRIEQSTDPAVMGIKSVIRKALQYNATDRPTAREMALELENIFKSPEQRQEVIERLSYKFKSLFRRNRR